MTLKRELQFNNTSVIFLLITTFENGLQKMSFIDSFPLKNNKKVQTRS